jgi:hypothetical protein
VRMVSLIAPMAAVATIGVAASSSTPATDEEAERTVADTVRDQGLPCADGVAAHRDPAASRPDEAAWVLTCSDARYRVRYMGDRAPEIERLE